jgi:hypothetical protein
MHLLLEQCTGQKKLSSGWELMPNKPKSRLTKEQKQFLEDKYYQGEKQNMKYNAVDVAHEMEILINGNEYVFEPYQWLKPSQIKSFWSRLTKNRRRSSEKQTITTYNTTSIDDDDDDDDQEEADEDESFEEIAHEVKQKLLKKQGKMVHEVAKDSSATLEMVPLSMKTKQSQRSMDNLANQQRKKRSIGKQSFVTIAFNKCLSLIFLMYIS